MALALRRLWAGWLLGTLAVTGWAASCPPAPESPTPATMERLQQQASDRGFLWRIRSEGHDSWLYGTMHVGRQDWLAPGPKVAAALGASEVLALEMNPLDASIQQRMAALAGQHAGEWPQALLPRVQKQMDKVCLPAAVRAALHPMMLMTTLELYGLRAQGLYGEYGQEYLLADWARARRMRTVSMETPEAQIQVLLGPDAAVVPGDLESALTASENGRSAKIAAALAQAWATSDLERLRSYAAWCDCVKTARDRAQVRALLDERNPVLADGIDALHRSGKTVFAAVGALHMIGPTGLPELLRQRGYEVEYQYPLPPSRAVRTRPTASDSKR
ncbi:TraB/GumN family protein [Xylophilus sp. GW821-FHT01B05]